MRVSIVAIATVVLLSACGATDETVTQATEAPQPDELSLVDPAPDIQAPTETPVPLQHGTYDELWSVTDGWPGEWPRGFSVIDENISVQGRNADTPYEPLLYTCALPQGATYHVWNQKRVDADSLAFRAAFYRSAITVTKAATLVDDFEATEKTLSVVPGDILRFEQYFADGIFSASFKDKTYTLYLEDVEAIADFEESKETDLWVNVKCADGSDLDRAWLKFDEVVERDGIEEVALSTFGDAQDVIPGTGYSVKWQKVDFWSGEYPSALAVTGDSVTVPAHATLRPRLEGQSTLSCPLPKNAVLTPWNQARPEVEYVTFVYQVPITINEDVTLEVIPRDAELVDGIAQAVSLNLKAGDTLTYKTYLGEGYFIAIYDGVEYDLSEGELPQSTVFGQGPDDEQWFGMACGTEGQVAWVNYEEALATQGVEIYNHTEYGAAYDLPGD